MSTTSRKHRDFVAEPMKGKTVTELPGVGDALGKRFGAAGYNSADAVLGQYLVRNRNKESFQQWMRSTSGANAKQSDDCYRALAEWSDEYI